jgi:phosphoserine phosphatase
LDFKAALRERVSLLRGLPVAALDRTLARTEPSRGAETLVRTMRAHGAATLLVSGGFRFFTEAIRERVGFDEDHSNQLETADGALTGRVVEPILDKDAKLATLRAAAAARGLILEDCLTVGDGANDLPMLKAAGLGVAYRAKPAVAAEVAVQVDHADLTALLYFQGYRAAELCPPTPDVS